MSAGFELTTDDGVRIVLEESHVLPLVDIEITLRSGAVDDPEGLDGLTRSTWRTVRMGTAQRDHTQVEEAISRIGARLVIETAVSYVRVHGVVIRRNLEAFLTLLGELLREPAFRDEDVAHVKREALADLVARRDSDRTLAAIAYRNELFGDHPYGRSTVGTEESLGAMDAAAVRDRYERSFIAGNVIIGFAGAVTPEELRGIVDRHFRRLPAGESAAVDVPEPQLSPGRRVVVVDKPARTQTQAYVGTLGTYLGDHAYYPLLVANTAFGGTFTATLMQEVREKRGWSYGAYSRLGGDRRRSSWSMWTHPTTEHAVECIALELELLERFVAEGPSDDEHAFAKKCLVNSHCFDLDTPSKRLEPKIDADLFGLPLSFYTEYERHVAAVDRAASADAVSRRLSSQDVVIAIVATASDVVDGLRGLPGVEQMRVIPYDAL